MKIAEIRELSDEELVNKIKTETSSYDQLKINHSISPLDSPVLITRGRKLIARLKTELRNRELNKKIK